MKTKKDHPTLKTYAGTQGYVYQYYFVGGARSRTI